MKHLRQRKPTIIIIFLFLFCTVISAAQTSQKNNTKHKTVLVNSRIFNPEKGGIELLARTEQAVFPEIDFYPMHMEIFIDQMKKEIDQLIAEKKPINEKYLELKNLEAERDKRNEESKTEMDEKQRKYIDPIIEKIKEKLLEFGQLKGYSIIVASFNNQETADDKEIDATGEFVQFCNEAFEKEKLEVPQMEDSKLLLMETGVGK